MTNKTDNNINDKREYNKHISFDDNNKSELEKTKKELEFLKNEVREYKKQLEDNIAGWQRTKADFINYKSRQEEFLNNAKKYSNVEIIKKLLPVIDSFYLATTHLPEELKNNEWAKGILCIKNQLDGFLKEAGVDKIKSIGKKFDPALFESVAEGESDIEEGIVIDEIQKGYKLFDKVIRPARVKISKSKSKQKEK